MGTIADLIMRGGDIAAQRSAQQGQIWGQAISNLGQIGAQAAERSRQEKEQSRREAALSEFISSGAWRGNPEMAYTGSLKILGPREGLRLAEGLMAADKIGNTQNPEDARRALPLLARSFKAMAPSLRQLSWGGVVDMVERAQLAPAGTLPREWNAETEQQMTPYLEALVGEAADQKLERVEVTNADGSKTVKFVVPAAGLEFTSAAAPKPDLKQIEAEAEARARGTRRGAPPQAAGGEGYVIEEPGPNGTVIKRLATAEELRRGITMAPRSTGQKPVTGAERTTLGFYQRMKDSLDTIESAPDGLASIEDRIAEYGPIDQGRLAYEGTGNNYLKSDEMQMYRQAQRQFTEARLRKESGAAIPPEEFRNDARIYFYQPGDSADTVKRKREARRVLLNGLRNASGRAYEEYYGEAAPKPGGAPPAGAASVPNIKIDPEVQRRLDRLRGL